MTIYNMIAIAQEAATARKDSCLDPELAEGMESVSPKGL